MNNFEAHYEEILKAIKCRVGFGCAITKVRKNKKYDYCDHNCDQCNKDNLLWLKEDFNNSKVHLVSDAEYALLKDLSRFFKWIARDKDKLFVTVYMDKPIQDTQLDQLSWYTESHYEDLDLFPSFFQFVKWEDDEPYEIAKLLEEYEKNK